MGAIVLIVTIVLAALTIVGSLVGFLVVGGTLPLIIAGIAAGVLLICGFIVSEV